MGAAFIEATVRGTSSFAGRKGSSRYPAPAARRAQSRAGLPLLGKSGIRLDGGGLNRGLAVNGT